MAKLNYSKINRYKQSSQSVYDKVNRKPLKVKPASVKQRSFMDALGITYPSYISSVSASNLIARRLEENKRKSRAG